LSTPGCGWCSFGGLNGYGVCMEGGLTTPTRGTCTALSVTLDGQTLPAPFTNWSTQATSPPTWSFGKCPAENECTNEHHSCDDSENCTDLEDGFRCDCKPGYVRDQRSEKCKPDCKQKCEPNGICVEPDNCQCNFGFVGHNCSTECQCNKHSNCQSVSHKDVCLACQNNTQGNHCEQCRPRYVGNPRDGGQCKSCHEFCNTHSNICISKEEIDIPLPQNIDITTQLNPGEIGSLSTRGPEDEQEATCLQCQDNTTGYQCEKCMRGYFRNSDTLEEGCQPCECNGHSAVCDSDTGIHCDCMNNTRSPSCDSSNQDSKMPCYQRQCSLCIDNYLGTPTNGHQCYCQMTVDNDYCFDPNTQMNCDRNPEPLLYGRTVFFGVQPKYLNVDIRIVIDVTVGGLDVYFAPEDKAFVVDVNKNTGIHHVDIDQDFQYHTIDPDSLARVKRFSPGPEGRLRTRRETKELPATDDAFNNSASEEKVFKLDEREAHDLNTFMTVKEPDTILVVRGVRHRLVITLPNSVHSLKVARFYLVLYGVGSIDSDETTGNLFFRQDQPHIDLFVFFSVFFSCFFLFLALCVLLWKLKQAVDARRRSIIRNMEMEHMAKRPFSRVTVIVDPEIDSVVGCVRTRTPTEPLPLNQTVAKAQNLPKQSSKYSLNSDPADLVVEQRYGVRTLALEPMDDGVSAVATFVIQLPGGSSIPIRACLASSLIQINRVTFMPSHQAKLVYLHHRSHTSNA